MKYVRWKKDNKDYWKQGILSDDKIPILYTLQGIIEKPYSIKEVNKISKVSDIVITMLKIRFNNNLLR